MSQQRAPLRQPEQSPTEPGCLPFVGAGLNTAQAAWGNAGLLGLLGLDREGAAAGIAATGAWATGGLAAAAGGVKGALGAGRAWAEGVSPGFGALAAALEADLGFKADMVAGFGAAGVDAGADLAGLALDPLGAATGLLSLASHAPLVGNGLRAGRLLLEGAGAGAALKETLLPTLSAEEAALWAGVGGKVLEPYAEAWAEGRPGEIAGRLAFELLPELLGVGLGAQAARAGTRLNHLGDASKPATAVNRFAPAELERLIRASVERANKLPGAKPRDASEVVGRAKLQDPRSFYREFVRGEMMGGRSKAEAIDAAVGVDAYVRRSSFGEELSEELFFRDDLPPHMREEVVQHEVNHLYAARGFKGPVGVAMEEGLVQWVTNRFLDRRGESYPNLTDLTLQLEQQLGADALLEVLVSGGSGRLGRLLQERCGMSLYEVGERYLGAHALDRR